jgi:hypothetical protein
MRRHARTTFLGIAATSVLLFGIAVAAEQEGEPLDGPALKTLASVTGFRSVKHRKSGLEARLLEADGSASVAQDPVSLFLVVTNNGSSDLVQRAWRIQRGVARVREFVATACGVDAKVDVDRIATDGRVLGRMPKVLHICFLSTAGDLRSKLMVSETSR